MVTVWLEVFPRATLPPTENVAAGVDDEIPTRVLEVSYLTKDVVVVVAIVHPFALLDGIVVVPALL